MINIRKIFDFLLSIILPKEESVLELENIDFAEKIDQLPKAPQIENDIFKALFQYKDKFVKKAIWEIKYRKNKKILEIFSKIFYEFILEDLSNQLIFNNFTNPTIVPIPVSRNTLRERGFNQCEIISRELSKIDKNKNFKIEFSALKKIKETSHQSKTKSRQDRLKNLSGCFSVDKDKIFGKNIILIDDVITTGSTMFEASKILNEAGAKKVIGYGIAY
jgi:competence protein ComFC